LSVLLVLQAVTSYRSVPRILELLKTRLCYPFQWVPHFTSVINWTLQLGLGMLKQVAPINEPWVAIVDHSIDIGTKKALVVLRVKMDSLSKRKQAICLEDCECIGLSISDCVKGESISLDLDKVFSQAGNPKAIIKDNDRTLHKGVRLYIEKQDTTPQIIEDIGHVIALALKSQFEKTDEYKHFIALTNKGAKNVRQTELAFLVPPKLRSKGRFQSIGKLGKWAEKVQRVLDKLTHITNPAEQEQRLLEKLNKALPDFSQSRHFINDFSNTTKVVSCIMKILKNNGLDNASRKQILKESEKLALSSKVKTRLLDWLHQHIDIRKKITTLPLLVSSDIIESLFGRFKHIIARSPHADMNRSTLLIPALCGKLDDVTMTQAMRQVSHHDLKEWENDSIPYTLRKKRQVFFDQINIQKPGN